MIASGREIQSAGMSPSLTTPPIHHLTEDTNSSGLEAGLKKKCMQEVILASCEGGREQTGLPQQGMPVEEWEGCHSTSQWVSSWRVGGGGGRGGGRGGRGGGGGGRR